jgi:uncharacterized protein YndB with AHSA1/START domain
MVYSIRRRDVPALFLGAGLAGAGAARAAAADPHQDEGLSFTGEAIHQEVSFDASPAKVYAALTDARQFDAVTQLGEAVKTMKLGRAPTRIDGVAGGAFALFGGFIEGRTIELVPDTLLVQTWREIPWPKGVYSLVRFALTAQRGGTALAFDHTGFPAGAGHHLSIGWYQNYWDPLKKYLAR